MVVVVESPERLEDIRKLPFGFRCIFLAGGITGCPDWQQEVVLGLIERNHPSKPLVLLNPRRKDFPIDDPSAAKQQITWEYQHLRAADEILFWFPRETLCPIVLYELGAWSITYKTMYVGVHPEYKRRQDVEIQTGLVRPGSQIVYSLTDLCDQIVGRQKIK